MAPSPCRSCCWRHTANGVAALLAALHWNLPRLLPKTLQYWHLLSLDAPTVAALWCWAFGLAAHLRLALRLPAALALGTWLFYVADRLFDAQLSQPSTLRLRHRFHHQHRRRFLAAAVPVGIALALLVARMPRSLLLAYCTLGALSLIYLGFVHLPIRQRSGPPSWFPKELAVGLLFAAATALPAWDEARRRAAGMPRHHPLLLLCPLFAALCWLNCMAIEEWEAGHSARHARLLAVGTAAAGLFCLSELFSDGARLLALVAVGSAFLFVLLDRSRLTAAARRVAADLVLLTPLLLLAAPRLAR